MFTFTYGENVLSNVWLNRIIRNENKTHTHTIGFEFDCTKDNNIYVAPIS